MSFGGLYPRRLKDSAHEPQEWGKWLPILGQGFSQCMNLEDWGLLTGGPGSPLGLRYRMGQEFFTEMDVFS